MGFNRGEVGYFGEILYIHVSIFSDQKNKNISNTILIMWEKAELLQKAWGHRLKMCLFGCFCFGLHLLVYLLSSFFFCCLLVCCVL